MLTKYFTFFSVLKGLIKYFKEEGFVWKLDALNYFLSEFLKIQNNSTIQ